MTETTTLPVHPENIASGPDLPLRPADILLHVIVTLLTPMFVCAGGGDIRFARMAALETVNAYRACNEVDLVAIAQIVGFGLSALGSLSLAMTDNLSLAMMLRLRGNANACNRSAEQNRRALRDNRARSEAPAIAPPMPVTEFDAGFDEAEVVAGVEAVQKRVAENQASLQAAAPAAEQAPVKAPAAAVPVTMNDRQREVVWAGAMAKVAAEVTAEIAGLPPVERRAATIRATALSSCAHELLSGKPAPRPRPGDLAAMMRGKLSKTGPGRSRPDAKPEGHSQAGS